MDGSAKARVEKNQFRALIYVCNPLTLCGGHGDRTNGILSAFLIALLTSRAFFIDFDSPLPLSLVLQPRLREAEASEISYWIGGYKVPPWAMAVRASTWMTGYPSKNTSRGWWRIPVKFCNCP